jgi:hypothetical protein
MVLAVATEERRSRRCEKLTPRLARPPDRVTIGGLLAQYELDIEERETDRCFMEKERCDGVLR